jgi:O-Antigen ligase
VGLTQLAENRLTVLANGAAVVVVAASVFLLSYANGGFDTTTRAYAAITAWWLLGVGAALGLGGARSQLSRLAVASSGLLALFAVWILLSMRWAPDAGRAFAQFDQVSLYVAVFVFAIVLARLVPASVLIGGVALALSAVAVVALVSRLFPSSFASAASTSQATVLPTLYARLSFPLGYWNGLGIAVALAYPLLIATMCSRRHPLLRAAAALPLPVIAADMYLTSSRGAFTAVAVAVAVYLALTANRWLGLAATIVAGASGAAAVKFLLPRKELIAGQPTALAAHQGHVAALAIGLIALGTAVVWVAVSLLAPRVPRVRREVGWATTALIVLLAVGIVVALHPIRRFEAFKAVPTAGGTPTTLTSHLLSSSGSGRWQLWSATVSQFRAHPLIGEGAGSWAFWWQQHGSLPLYFGYAHSLYLETLGELGIVGLLLLGSAVLLAVGGAVRASLVLRSSAVAAATAAGIAFFAAAAYDWVWQLGSIAVVGIGCLGIALGALPSGRAVAWGRFGLIRPLLALVAVAAIVPQVVALSAELHLRNSNNAALALNGARARSEALAAKAVEPWSSEPYLQLALVAEQQGRYTEARTWISAAIDRSDRNYQLWVVAAKIDTERVHISEAAQDIAEAKRLYPGASVFNG